MGIYAGVDFAAKAWLNGGHLSLSLKSSRTRGDYKLISFLFAFLLPNLICLLIWTSVYTPNPLLSPSLSCFVYITYPPSPSSQNNASNEL